MAKKQEEVTTVDPRMKLIGKRIKELRIEAGYSSGENFATDHRIGRMAYWRCESGTSNITMQTLFTVLDAHDMTLSDFFAPIEEM